MTKKYISKSLRRWIQAIDKWVYLLWLGDHERTYQLTDEKLPAETDGASQFLTAARCENEPRYKKVYFSINKWHLDSTNDNDLDETACHEVIHQIIGPLNDVAYEVINSMPKSKQEGWHKYRIYQMEFVTSHLTNVIRQLYKSPKGK